MSTPFVSNIISQKYDTALDFHVTMYDNLPYQRDSDYCNIEKVTLVSGHIIKYYLCFNQPESFLVNNKDDEIEQILANAAIIEKEYASHREQASLETSDDIDVTPEQIQTLLDDNGISTEEEDELAASANAVNAFADVEDW